MITISSTAAPRVPHCTSHRRRSVATRENHAPPTDGQMAQSSSRRSVQILALLLGLAFATPGLSQEAGAHRIVEAARAQVGRTVRYDPAYVVLAYPNGDVPLEGGVCTDVVVRAFRSGLGVDLQQAVHEDMRRHFNRYPRIWGLRGPDRNIDHRRVPNLQTYFRRRGYELPVSRDPADYLPGDLVTCTVPPHLPHIMIVSDRTGEGGRPLVIHNIGRGAREEDRLFEFPITGRYRLPLQPTTGGRIVQPSGG